MSEEIIDQIREKVSDLEALESFDCPAFKVSSDKLKPAMQALLKELRFDFLLDISGVDHGESAEDRFSVVYHLYSSTDHQYLRLKCDCQMINEEPFVSSVADLWPAADWHEREAFDMFGIRFEGHPNLKRILMWDDYPYFPLRKEFPLAGIDVELPADDVAEETGVSVKPAPMMGGPFHASLDNTMSKREPRAADQSWTEFNEKPSAEQKEDS